MPKKTQALDIKDIQDRLGLCYHRIKKQTVSRLEPPMLEPQGKKKLTALFSCMEGKGLDHKPPKFTYIINGFLIN